MFLLQHTEVPMGPLKRLLSSAGADQAALMPKKPKVNLLLNICYSEISEVWIKISLMPVCA